MKSNRIPSLDGVRAISIALVLLDHLNKWGHIQAKIAGSYGTTGVHIFFVLSGYLITSLLLQEHDRDSTVGLGRFYVRRAFRIFPAAFAVLPSLACACISYYFVEQPLLKLRDRLTQRSVPEQALPLVTTPVELCETSG